MSVKRKSKSDGGESTDSSKRQKVALKARENVEERKSSKPKTSVTIKKDKKDKAGNVQNGSKIDPSVHSKKKKPLIKKKVENSGNAESKNMTEEERKKQMREKQKTLKHNRQQTKKESGVFDLGVQAKKVWEELRREDCPENRKNELLTELNSLVKGNLSKIIRAHDTVRVVECLMSLGGPEVRESLYQELKGELVDLAKSKYATFFVQKLLKYGTKVHKEGVLKALEGKIAELTRHKIGNNVVETCFNDIGNARRRNRILQEFYGPEFRLLKEEELRTVLDVVEKHPEKERGIKKALAENCNILISKGCYNLSVVHTVLYNYMLLLNHQITKQSSETVVDIAAKAKKARSDLVSQLRDVCVHVLHSHDGSRLCMNALWHGSAKDRKAIVKSFKTFVKKICLEEHGHLTLLATFDAMDDTKLVGKAIIGEITEKDPDNKFLHLGEILASETGSKVIKYILVGRNTTYFHPDYLALLKQGDGNEFTKKDDDIRRKELLQAAEGQLFEYLQNNLEDQLKFGNRIIMLQAALSSLASEKVVEPLLKKLAEVIGRNFEPGVDNYVENPAVHRLLKKVLSLKGDVDGGRGRTFAKMLLDSIRKEKSVNTILCCNRGAFLMVAMLEMEDPEVGEEVRKLVEGNIPAEKDAKSKGLEILQSKL